MNQIEKQDVIIVDEDDNIIWYKKRGTILQEDIYRVSALLIKNSNWEFLLAQRAFTKKNNPWEWSFSVAGIIERWEDYDSNIIKETEEEIWLTDLEIHKTGKLRILWKHNFFCQFYVALSDKRIDQFKIQDDELEAIRWFNINEIKGETFEWYDISKTLVEYLDMFS